MNIYLTADIEIWCNGWNDIDVKFPNAFDKYIYGKTPSGEYGLRYQLEKLKEHNLKCTFFVEPLFTLRFGLSPLKEIVDLIQSYGQKVELHTHTEWLDEAKEKPFPHITEKRQHINFFNLEEQTKIISLGKSLLEKAGVHEVSAYRAGSFAFNMDTIEALNRNAIYIDSSYNTTQLPNDSLRCRESPLIMPFRMGNIIEYPLTAYYDFGRRLRHTQLSACSYSETSYLLKELLESNASAFTFLFHNFELLNQSQTKADRIAIKRFNRITELLDKNSNLFPTFFMCDRELPINNSNFEAISTPIVKTASRMFEQLFRKIYE